MTSGWTPRRSASPGRMGARMLNDEFATTRQPSTKAKRTRPCGANGTRGHQRGAGQGRFPHLPPPLGASRWFFCSACLSSSRWGSRRGRQE